MSSESMPFVEYQRGCQLIELRRYADAEKVFRGILAREPNDHWALHQLAYVMWRQDRAADALPVVMTAMGADPEVSAHQILRSLVLVSLGRLSEALSAADEAIRLDPTSADAFAARAQALSAKSLWSESEGAALQALALDPENALASHYLAHSLRQQGKVRENEAVVREQLRRDPNSPLAHANAGWAALERGDRRVAEKHFAEALRLSPDMEWARDGLLHSFRARSPLYRGYLAYNLWMSKRPAGHRWMIIIGLWLGMRFSRVLFTGNTRWLGLGLSVAYIAFVFWVWLARGIGNLLLLFDPFARMVLRRYEKLEAIFVGGGLAVGVVLAVTGFVLPHDIFLVAGISFVFAAVPFACTFDNTQKLGRWLFGGIGTLAWVVAISVLTALVLPQGWDAKVVNAAMEVFPIALIGCVGTTWLGNVPYLHKRH